MDTKPNIFHWATSELSQDAFICWLLSWANYKEERENALKDTALYLLSKLTDNRIKKIDTIEVKKQYKHIDVLVKVNDEYAILIEDKIHAKNHIGQLERYSEILLEEYKKENIFSVYLKTGDQGQYNSVKKAGYKPFLRNDLIEVLEFALKSGVNNNILLDFHSHLTNIEQSVLSYKTLPVKDWHRDSWKGFYTELAKRLGDGDWDYVPQKDGGFWGFWWCWLDKNHEGCEFEYYLQLEHGKFCFKLYPYEREKAYEIRQHYRTLLYEKAKEHSIDIYQNGRIGNYMTVAALTESYLKTDEKGIIDFDNTVNLVRRIEKMMLEI